MPQDASSQSNKATYPVSRPTQATWWCQTHGNHRAAIAQIERLMTWVDSEFRILWINKIGAISERKQMARGEILSLPCPLGNIQSWQPHPLPSPILGMYALWTLRICSLFWNRQVHQRPRPMYHDSGRKTRALYYTRMWRSSDPDRWVMVPCLDNTNTDRT